MFSPGPESTVLRSHSGTWRGKSKWQNQALDLSQTLAAFRTTSWSSPSMQQLQTSPTCSGILSGDSGINLLHLSPSLEPSSCSWWPTMCKRCHESLQVKLQNISSMQGRHTRASSWPHSESGQAGCSTTENFVLHTAKEQNQNKERGTLWGPVFFSVFPTFEQKLMTVSYLILINKLINHWNVCPPRQVHLSKLKEFVPTCSI